MIVPMSLSPRWGNDRSFHSAETSVRRARAGWPRSPRRLPTRLSYRDARIDLDALHRPRRPSENRSGATSTPRCTDSSHRPCERFARRSTACSSNQWRLKEAGRAHPKGAWDPRGGACSVSRAWAASRARLERTAEVSKELPLHGQAARARERPPVFEAPATMPPGCAAPGLHRPHGGDRCPRSSLRLLGLLASAPE